MFEIAQDLLRLASLHPILVEQALRLPQDEPFVFNLARDSTWLPKIFNSFLYAFSSHRVIPQDDPRPNFKILIFFISIVLHRDAPTIKLGVALCFPSYPRLLKVAPRFRSSLTNKEHLLEVIVIKLVFLKHFKKFMKVCKMLFMSRPYPERLLLVS